MTTEKYDNNGKCWYFWFGDDNKTMVSCQKGPTRHAYAWQIGPFLQDTLEEELQIYPLDHLNLNLNKEGNQMN